MERLDDGLVRPLVSQKTHRFMRNLDTIRSFRHAPPWHTSKNTLFHARIVHNTILPTHPPWHVLGRQNISKNADFWHIRNFIASYNLIQKTTVLARLTNHPPVKRRPKTTPRRNTLGLFRHWVSKLFSDDFSRPHDESTYKIIQRTKWVPLFDDAPDVFLYDDVAWFVMGAGKSTFCITGECCFNLDNTVTRHNNKRPAWDYFF